jgi:TRAP-type C4-dicarboxylate transport system permease small subunit
LRVLENISDFIYRIERVLIGLTVSIIFLALILEVIFRYFLNNPLEWSGELAMYALIWTTFIGGSMSIKLKTATSITVLTDRLGTKLKRVLSLTTQIIVTLFCIFVLVYSLQWVLSPNTLIERSLSMGVPMIIPYFGIPLGIGFMTIHSLYHLFNEVINGSRSKVGDA